METYLSREAGYQQQTAVQTHERLSLFVCAEQTVSIDSTSETNLTKMTHPVAVVVVAILFLFSYCHGQMCVVQMDFGAQTVFVFLKSENNML